MWVVPLLSLPPRRLLVELYVSLIGQECSLCPPWNTLDNNTPHPVHPFPPGHRDELLIVVWRKIRCKMLNERSVKVSPCEAVCETTHCLHQIGLCAISTMFQVDDVIHSWSDERNHTWLHTENITLSHAYFYNISPINVFIHFWFETLIQWLLIFFTPSRAATNDYFHNRLIGRLFKRFID